MNYQLKVRLLNFTCLFLFLTNFNVLAQSDTTWYDAAGYPVTSEKAFSYRLKPIQADSGYKVEEFYLTGEIKMEGFSSSADGRTLEGWATWYAQDGDIVTKILYDEGIREKYISYWKGKEFAVAEYSNNQPVEGTVLFYMPSSKSYLMASYQSGIMNSIQIFKDELDGIRYSYTLTEDIEGDTLRQYEFYDEKGELIGKYECVDLNFELYADEEDRLKKNGTFVDYYSDPMQVGAIIRYKKGKVLNRKDYYRTGALKKEVVVDGDTAIAKYYKSDGSLIGEFKGPYNDIYQRFNQGGSGAKVYFYDDNQSKSSPIKKIVKQQDGKDVELKTFSVSGELTKLIKYRENGGRHEQHFNKEGELLYEIIWKNHSPYHGTYILNDEKHEIYSKGKKIKRIFFYKTGEKFSVKKDTIETYYHKDGNVMAKARFKSFESKIPIEGTKMQLVNGKLRSEKRYKNGKEIQLTEFFHSNKPYKISKKETFYGEDEKRFREKSYYSTGDIRSDIFYDGYQIRSATYYDKKGNVIGELQYSDRKQIGTEVDFYYETDLIESIITYNEEGEIVSEKRYDKRIDENLEPYTILEAEIQTNGTSRYYDYSGSFLAEAEFKNGEPFSGATVEHPNYNYDYDLYIIKPYKESKLNGTVKKYRYYHETPSDPVLMRETTYQNGQRYGADKRYFSDGKLRRIQNYKDDQLHGESISYTEDGNVLEQNSYEEGKPFDGLFNRSISYDKAIEYEYDEGVLVYCVFTKEERLIEKTTSADGKFKTIIYGDSAEVKTTIILDEHKNGSVIHYDQGKEKSKNILKEGIPFSGVFYFNEFHNYNVEEFGDAEYLEVNFTLDTWELTAYNQEEQEIFKLREQKNWKESNAISRYMRVENYLNEISLFYKYQWSRSYRK